MAKLSKLKVKVLEKHINKGVRDSAFNCPICLAIQGMHIGTPELKMDGSSPHWVLTIDNAGDKVQYVVPFAVDTFCVAFDKGERVAPFQFTAVRFEESDKDD